MTSRLSFNPSKTFEFVKTAFRVCVVTPTVKTYKSLRDVHGLLSQMYNNWYPGRLNFTRWQRVTVVFLLEVMFWAICIGIVLAVISLITLNISGLVSVFSALLVIAFILLFVAIILWIYSAFGFKMGSIALVVLIIVLAIIGAMLG